MLSADVVLSRILSDNCVAGSLPTWRIRGSSIVVGIQNECFGNKEMEYYYYCCIAVVSHNAHAPEGVGCFIRTCSSAEEVFGNVFLM